MKALLDVVPPGWKLGRIKDLVRSCVNGVWGDEPEIDEEGTPTVRVADFDWEHLLVGPVVPTQRLVPPRQLRRVGLAQGDLVLEKSGGGQNQPVGRAVRFIGTKPAVCSNFTARLRPTNETDSRYLCYSLAAMYWAGINTRSIKQTTGIQNLDSNSYMAEPWAFPGLHGQGLIADFLDQETHRIDALVDAKRRLRSRLAEKATAVITHGVTRGMDFSRQMRFVGGLPPLEIPDHWEAQRLAVAMKQITNGYVGPTRDILVDNGVRYVQSLHIKEGRIDFHTPYYVSEQWAAARSRTRLRQGDLLLVQTGDIGQSAVVTREFDGAQCHALIIMRRRRSHDEPRYFGYALRSSAVRSAILKTATGALHPHLNVGLVRDVRVPVPPADEQRAIVSWIDRKLDAIDSARKAIDSQLDLLTEFRRALITQAVTGQLDEATLKGDKRVDEAVGVIPE